jgi:signal transduction histidine kinase/ActR/RegA family two-component response regulator
MPTSAFMPLSKSLDPAAMPAEVPPVLYLLGGDGTLRWLSDSLMEFCGVDPMELLGQPLASLVRFEDAETTTPINGTLLRNGKMRFSDGTLRAVRVAEVRRDGLPGFGTISPSGSGLDGSALAAVMGQVALWRLDLRSLQSRSYGRLAESFGFADDLSPRGWLELVHPDDVPGYQAQLESIGRGQTQVVEIESRARRRDGRWLWTLTRGEVSRRDDTGYPIELAGVTFDIGKQKDAELELQAHRALLRRSLRLARVAAWSYDTASGEQIWTDEASELLAVPTGYVPDALLGLELFDGESQVRVQKALARALDEGIGFDQELLRITPQGRVLWVRAVANPEFESGVMVRLSGLFQDITRQRRMEQAVRDSEQLLRQLTAGLPDAIFQLRRSTDGAYHLDFLSEGIRKLLDLAPDAPLPEFSGLMAALSPELHQSMLRSLELAATRRELWSHELTLKSDDALSPSLPGRVLLGRAQPEPQLDGSCLYFGFFSDVTEQRRQAIALRDAELTQQRLTRLEAVGQLAGGIAHDFNNYLTSIVMSLSLLEAQPELSRDAIQLVREALSATSSAQALTRQLLTFSRGSAPVKQVMETEALVREAVAFTLRGSAVECRVLASQTVWPVEVDPGQIQQVLQNLVLNASQAMHGVGQLQICISNVPPGSVEVPGLAPGPSVRIEVIDKGPGVPAHIREKLFQPYVTSKEQGSGLGLASAFSIVRKHEGLITYESGAQGSTFSVWLPAVPKRAIDSQGSRSAMMQGSGKILVMDDNEGILKMLTRALSHLGFESTSAHDGAEALVILQAALDAGAPFRAVILDQTIPGGIGGAEALKLLRAADPHVRAIATSGYTEGETMANYQEFGFNGVLRKPFRIQDLANVLSEVLA